MKNELLNKEHLEGAIKEIMADKFSSDHFQALTSKALDKTIESAVDNAPRPYSESGKAILKAVQPAGEETDETITTETHMKWATVDANGKWHRAPYNLTRTEQGLRDARLEDKVRQPTNRRRG